MIEDLDASCEWDVRWRKDRKSLFPRGVGEDGGGGFEGRNGPWFRGRSGEERIDRREWGSRVNPKCEDRIVEHGFSGGNLNSRTDLSTAGWSVSKAERGSATVAKKWKGNLEGGEYTKT